MRPCVATCVLFVTVVGLIGAGGSSPPFKSPTINFADSQEVIADAVAPGESPGVIDSPGVAQGSMYANSAALLIAMVPVGLLYFSLRCGKAAEVRLSASRRRLSLLE